MSHNSSVSIEGPRSETECVFSLDRDWKLTYLNATARERLGMGDECLGHDATRLFPLSWATYARDIVEDALERGIPAQFHFYGRELGSWFDIDVRPTSTGADIAFRDLTHSSARAAQRNLFCSPAITAAADEVRRRTVRLSQGAFGQTGQRELQHLGCRSDGQLALLAEAIYRDRRRRAEALSIESAEPQWDILLDLFVQSVRNNPVSVTSACIAADVPHSTALRALEQLSEHGIITREADLTDKRRIWVRLSFRGREGMRNYLRQTAMAVGL